MSEIDGRTVLFTALKWAVLIALLVGIISRLRGDAVSNASFETVETAVLASADADAMQEGDRQMIRRLYGLDPDDYEDIALYYPASSMGAEELLLVKLSDTDQTEAVTAAMEARLDTQLASFEGYGTEQTAMLKNAVIDASGNYVLFVSASDPEAVREAYAAALKEDV